MKLILDVLVREQVLSQGTGQAELNRLLEIFSRNSRAMENYRMRPITQRIILFPAADREAPELLAEKWNIWATEGVEVCAVPCDHYTLLRPPNVSKIASLLTHYLGAGTSAAAPQ